MIPIKMFIYMCVFIAMENIVVGMVNILNKNVPWEQRKTGLMFSYVWMIPLYIIAPVLFELFTFIYSVVHIHFLLIILINYIFGVVVITALETGLGAILVKYIGTCPWGVFTKQERGIFLGYSRWDWSLMYGLITVLFYYFIQTLRWL